MLRQNQEYKGVGFYCIYHKYEHDHRGPAYINANSIQAKGQASLN